MKTILKGVLVIVLNLVIVNIIIAQDSTNTNKSPLEQYIDSLLLEHDTIQIDLYVMSQCLYAIKAENILVPILIDLKDKVKFDLFFIARINAYNDFTSLHGEDEVLEDRRQLVISRHFPDKLYYYLLERGKSYNNCDWTIAANAIGFNVKYIDNLVQSEEEIIAFTKNVSIGNMSNVFASPTLIINGERYLGNFSENYQKATGICDGGANDGGSCSSSFDCPGICDTGRNAGGSCNGDEDCSGTCSGGSNSGGICSFDSDCPGGQCLDFGACLDFGYCDFLLQVGLINFKVALMENGEVLLRWITLSEINNAGFEIEHSTDGKKWNDLGFIEGQGTTTSRTYYMWIGNMPKYGINYYRLKQIDFNGNFKYYGPISITAEFNLPKTISIYPNPCDGLVHIKTEGSMPYENLEIRVYNSYGSCIYNITVPVTSNEIEINLGSDIPKGLYLFELQTTNKTFHDKLVLL